MKDEIKTKKAISHAHAHSRACARGVLRVCAPFCQSFAWLLHVGRENTKNKPLARVLQEASICLSFAGLELI
jgi:hypothetical protein